MRRWFCWKWKSAFLLALAGELAVQKGTIERSRTKLAFANQDPWIMNGSVEENIRMGLPYDGTFYNEIVKSCGLDVDFKQFIDGDKTIVGDRGVQCSGGQVSIYYSLPFVYIGFRYITVNLKIIVHLFH